CRAALNVFRFRPWTHWLYLGRVVAMPKDRPLSPQSTSVIAALAMVPSTWRHGYELAKQTGLKSGTLYPILIRLAERGLVEAQWENEETQGRPRSPRVARADLFTGSPQPAGPPPTPSPSGMSGRSRRPTAGPGGRSPSRGRRDGDGRVGEGVA